ncbi:RNA polymerase II transcription elongation factor-domain-containing protein [Trametes polyzona]|nr:RNA polymerase II transcription elongation factor-domain-containing protein [Trametes polyzona]
MTSTASNAWMPTGRHEVNIGSSLLRALKARKGGLVKSSKAKPDREFYSFRYNFKPESVDPTKPGSIEIKKPKEGGPTNVNVVRPSTQNEHGVNYVGQERPVREYDCVLIYDEELGTFTLEKIESSVTLQHDPRTVHAPRHANSPAPPAPQRPPSVAKREEEEESEGEILELPKSKPSSRPITSAPQPKAKPTAPAPHPAPRSLPPSLPPKPVQSAVPPRPTPAAASPPLRPTSSAQPPASTSAPKPRPRPVTSTASSSKGVNKRPADADEAPEPRRTVQPPPPKKAKVVPEKKKEPVTLALPGSGAPPALALPSSSNAATQPPSLSLPTSSSIVTLPPAPTPTSGPAPFIPDVEMGAATAVTDSDEEEWDEVQPSIAPVPAAPISVSLSAPAPPPLIVMEEIEPSASTPPTRGDGADDGEGQEIDVAAFEEELEELADPEADAEAEDDAEGEPDEDDFLMGAMSPVAERQPVSLSRFAGGAADFGDDDDYSSSEESDEED